MKIRVSYSELKSGPGYNNQRAEAEIEMEVHGDINQAFDETWQIVKTEVKGQLQPVINDLDPDIIDNDLPF